MKIVPYKLISIVSVLSLSVQLQAVPFDANTKNSGHKTISKKHKRSHSAELHDDGITRPYQDTKEARNYFNTIDKKYLPYMKAPQAVMDAWQDDKFGFFICWDHSSQAPVPMSWGRKGRRPRHSSDGKVVKGLAENKYDDLAKSFDPKKFDAEQWLDIVKDSGAKYLVFTAKHHAGFSMFDSAVTDFDVMNTPFNRDVVKELSEAAHKAGIKFYLYYSQPDWTHPDYREDETYERYIREFFYPQLKELVTNYGKIDGIWFDGLGKNPEAWHAPEMLAMLRKIQPNLIFNHRYAPRNWRMGDFDGPEREIGRFQTNRPWETCTVIGGAWGWTGDQLPMNLADSLSVLIRTAGNGGNLLLNTGPNGNGEINPIHAKRYREMGVWLKKFGESIYGTRGGPYMPGVWGSATYKENTVYLHILANWNDETLVLPELKGKILSVHSLTGGKATASQANGQLTVKLAKKYHHNIDTVIAIELDKPIKDIKAIKTLGDSHTIGAVVTASSEIEEAKSIVAKNMTEFSEGILVRKRWSPSKTDKTPWIQLNYPTVQAVSGFIIKAGKYGDSLATDLPFTVELHSQGKWRQVHQGSSLRMHYPVMLNESMDADAIRIQFSKNSKISIASINSYSDFKNIIIAGNQK